MDVAALERGSESGGRHGSVPMQESMLAVELHDDHHLTLAY
jgi:hypothetical protein